MFLLPIACLLACGRVITGKREYSQAALRIALVGLVIFFIVPASVWLSDKVYQTQASTVSDTIEEYNDLDIEGESDGGFFNELTTITTDTIDRITSFIDNLLESLAVMIVTACVIPLLVLVFLIWLIRTVFSTNILTLDPRSLRMITDRLEMKDRE